MSPHALYRKIWSEIFFLLCSESAPLPQGFTGPFTSLPVWLPPYFLSLLLYSVAVFQFRSCVLLSPSERLTPAATPPSESTSENLAPELGHSWSACPLRDTSTLHSRLCWAWACLWVAMSSTYTLTLPLVLLLPPVLSALLTNDGFPFPIGLCDLIGAAHLTEGHASDDKDHDTWTGAVLSRCLILVPVAIPGTARAERWAWSHYMTSLAWCPVTFH